MTVSQGSPPIWKGGHCFSRLAFHVWRVLAIWENCC